ncbi:MAG TPA: hypothetical protein DEO70_11780 [Bacteroidales bacterium]|nr:MAG: hypothetical protein A2X11_09765 [Bacteroidetes bacterium GWE2_42_24]OFY26217.1 MAG: hypothetical protein A2X09_05380 [Bacteroidetes bacterium GWF2_43_11]HBZ67507.1 hypothetical protein [Bacteroidales bacterium]
MNYRRIIAFSIFLLFSIAMYSQNGFIRGAVFDEATGEYLPGVTIVLEGTTQGTITDLDGKFNLSVAAGTYNVKVSFISYEAQLISGIVVRPGKASVYDNIRLKEAAINLEAVTIVASQLRNSENALLSIKMKSANLLDGISASNLRKIGDSDAASAMKRVPGVSVEGGKYVFIRGLGDRYTKTTLNGVDIPGLDPDRNTLQMDIFPGNIIDNMIVHKSFSAELPADFTGGVVNIVTKDFPDDKTGNISVGVGYSPQSHFNKDFLTYEGSPTDFLGFDNGTRDIPATTDIPFFSDVVGNPNGSRAIRYKEILRSFNPVMAAEKKTSLMDYNFGFNLGNQFQFRKHTMGYNLAFSYKSTTEFYKDAEYGRYGLSGNADHLEMEVREFQKGDYGVSTVLLSGLAGFAVKSANSRYRINLLHIQNGESKAGIFDYVGSDQGSNFEGFQHNLDYSQRSLTNLLIDGRHTIPGSKWEIEWKLSPTISRNEEPDNRFTRYIVRGGSYVISTESGFPERIWRDLKEINLTGQLHVTKSYQFLGENAKLLFGGAEIYKKREFIIRNFALNIRGLELTGDPNELFAEENLWPMNGSANHGTTYEAPFLPVNPNQFDANIMNTAGYVATEINPFRRLKAILGLRAENHVQRYTGRDQLGLNVLDNDKVLDDLSFFPSVNLVYSISEKQNLRASYSMTVARPSFKELSYAEIFDPISGRTFIGGLFRDANDVAGIVYWDGNLVSTSIQNFDLRYELFLNDGQLVSLSGFYKSFNKPIEIVQYATQTGSFQPRNVGDGELVGAELELRKNLGFIHEIFNELSLTANITFTDSKIELSQTEFDSRELNKRTGQTIEKYRDMAGQSPYLINAGLLFTGSKQGFQKGLECGIFYNVQGETLQYVGIADRPDIYLKPFHSLNFNANKRFGKDNRYQIGLKVDNILNSKTESIFKSFGAADQYFSRLSPGIGFQLRFSYNLFN